MCAHVTGAIKTARTACRSTEASLPKRPKSPCQPADDGQTGTSASVIPIHAKALLPIDQWTGPAGSSMSGFRTQAPEILRPSRRSQARARTTASGRSRRSGRSGHHTQKGTSLAPSGLACYCPTRGAWHTRAADHCPIEAPSRQAGLLAENRRRPVNLTKPRHLHAGTLSADPLPGSYSRPFHRHP